MITIYVHIIVSSVTTVIDTTTKLFVGSSNKYFLGRCKQIQGQILTYYTSTKTVELHKRKKSMTQNELQIDK